VTAKNIPEKGRKSLTSVYFLDIIALLNRNINASEAHVMSKTKVVNYTPEMETRMKEVYIPSATQDERTAQVAEIATEFNRSTRSVVAKLTTMGVYVAKTYRTKQGGAVVRKETIVRAIEAQVGAELDGLEKATKNALVRIYNALYVEPETKTEADNS
jgi:hypothetical protein